jgi:hypothetical protein
MGHLAPRPWRFMNGSRRRRRPKLNVALRPIPGTWTRLTTGTFSGGLDSYTDTRGGTNPQQFYMISVP